jgi:DNA-directed RNA polymerase specialized sigma subunit
MRFINMRSVAIRRSVQEFRNLSKVKATLKTRLERPQTNSDLAARATLDEEIMGYDTFDNAHLSLDPPPVFTANYSEAQTAIDSTSMQVQHDKCRKTERPWQHRTSLLCFSSPQGCSLIEWVR